MDSNNIFKNVSYYLIGNIPSQIGSLLKANGAQKQRYLSEFVTHCIADEYNDEVSEAKELYELCVIKSCWVEQSLLCGYQLMCNLFELNQENSLFSNVVACISKLSVRDSIIIKGLITNFGGVFKNNFDHLITHLITTDCSGAKYLLLREQNSKSNNKVVAVTPDWVLNSYKSRILLDECLFNPKYLINALSYQEKYLKLKNKSEPLNKINTLTMKTEKPSKEIKLNPLKLIKVYNDKELVCCKTITSSIKEKKLINYQSEKNSKLKKNRITRYDFKSFKNKKKTFRYKLNSFYKNFKFQIILKNKNIVSNVKHKIKGALNQSKESKLKLHLKLLKAGKLNKREVINKNAGLLNNNNSHKLEINLLLNSEKSKRVAPIIFLSQNKTQNHISLKKLCYSDTDITKSNDFSKKIINYKINLELRSPANVDVSKKSIIIDALIKDNSIKSNNSLIINNIDINKTKKIKIAINSTIASSNASSPINERCIPFIGGNPVSNNIISNPIDIENKLKCSLMALLLNATSDITTLASISSFDNFISQSPKFFTCLSDSISKNGLFSSNPLQPSSMKLSYNSIIGNIFPNNSNISLDPTTQIQQNLKTICPILSPPTNIIPSSFNYLNFNKSHLLTNSNFSESILFSQSSILKDTSHSLKIPYNLKDSPEYKVSSIINPLINSGVNLLNTNEKNTVNNINIKVFFKKDLFKKTFSLFPSNQIDICNNGPTSLIYELIMPPLNQFYLSLLMFKINQKNRALNDDINFKFIISCLIEHPYTFVMCFINQLFLNQSKFLFLNNNKMKSFFSVINNEQFFNRDTKTFTSFSNNLQLQNNNTDQFSLFFDTISSDTNSNISTSDYIYKLIMNLIIYQLSLKASSSMFSSIILANIMFQYQSKCGLKSLGWNMEWRYIKLMLDYQSQRDAKSIYSDNMKNNNLLLLSQKEESGLKRKKLLDVCGVDNNDLNVYYGHELPDLIPDELSLLGCIFFIADYQMSHEDYVIKSWIKVINKFGGQVDRIYSNRVTHLICEHQKSDVFFLAKRDGKRLVTVFWLQDCLFKRKMAPPWCAVHFPSYFGYLNPASSYLISVTNFVGEERVRVKNMIAIVCAQYVGLFTKLNSVLIAKSLFGPKCEKALEWKVPIVNIHWLNDLILGERNVINSFNLPKYQTFVHLSKKNNLQNKEYFDGTSYEHQKIVICQNNKYCDHIKKDEKISKFASDANEIEDFFRVDYRSSEHLMEGWKQPLKVSSEFWKFLPSNDFQLYGKYNEVSFPAKYLESNADMSDKNRNQCLDSSKTTVNNVGLNYCHQMESEECPSVLLTGFSKIHCLYLTKDIVHLGGRVTNLPKLCSHLVTNHLLRTVKFLTSISYAKFVLSLSWIEESVRKGKFVDEKNFILSDKMSEIKYNIHLTDVFMKAKKRNLFKGFYFHITANVRPSHYILANIIESSGGVIIEDPSKLNYLENKNFVSNLIIISCEKDLDECQGFKQKKIEIHNAEIILTGILRQEMDRISYRFL